ncbi:TIGR02679 family protein [Sporomusa termitida]|uniref:TIGR02679: family protein n=1 Tax=Sporomusa termitida TaxID=2377 RepID=A0A517DRF2_9FIRM|nr:TIGR02679 family protein [Sporomusa termitida]QDR79941.1 TIGR02679: family protein [Sporomusa termitida]
MDTEAREKAAQAAAFFRSQPGFTRFFELLGQKYRRLGRSGGSIRLLKLTAEERQALSAFFRINFEGKDSIRISFSQFAAGLGQTCFFDIDVIALLQAYHGGQLLTNHEQLAAAETARQQFFTELRAASRESLSLLWLSGVEAKLPGTRRAQAVYEQGRPENIAVFKVVLSALDSLPADYLRLPLFAQQIAGQPHALDNNTGAGRLFLEALRVIKQEQGEATEGETQAGLTAVEQEAELLYSVKLLRDDLLNFVTCAGLVAYDNQTGGWRPVAYWQQAWETGAVLNVPLRETVKYSALVPAQRSDTAEQTAKRVFIVENSGVFSAIVDKAAGQGYPLPPLVCLHGQFKLASWAALDLLAAGGCTLYYSGDFDPEGLLMAERLVKRYPEAQLWHYSVDEYNTSLLRNNTGYGDEAISNSRLKQLDGLTIPQLRAIAGRLRETKRASYQESFIERLAENCILG